jgi:hypothetical protein
LAISLDLNTSSKPVFLLRSTKTNYKNLTMCILKCVLLLLNVFLCFQQFYSYRTLPKVKIILTTSLRSQIRCRCLVAKFSVIKLKISLFLYKIKYWPNRWPTIFKLYRGGQFYWWRKPEYLERKPPICRKSLTNFITWCCIDYTSPGQDSNSQIGDGHCMHM